ncbi:MAG: transcriptional repressor [Verrucomicrobia bacterium]|nr:transcriptional repressor [Verrucomicrobiota bacterium]
MERRTKQREVIWRTIQQAGRPLGPQEVLKLAQQRLPNLGIATVYRTLKAFLEDRRIVVVEVPGHTPKYELADLKHHHHFVCRKCDRTFDVNDCPRGIKNMAPPGFVVEEHYVALKGICPDCRNHGAGD